MQLAMTVLIFEKKIVFPDNSVKSKKNLLIPVMGEICTIMYN